MFNLKFQRPDNKRIVHLAVQQLTGSFLILTARAIYFQHNYYHGLLSYDSRELLNVVLWVLLALFVVDSLRNFLFTVDLKPTKMTLIFVVWLKVIYNIGQFANGKREYVKFNIDGQTKTALLALGVKFFYIPLMISFLTSNYAGVSIQVSSLPRDPVTFDVIFNLIVSALFTIDTLIFTFGYLIEADFLHNRIKSVEPTTLGWVAALSTYPPFNGVTSQFLLMVGGTANFIGQNLPVYQVVKVLILLCHFIFVASSVSLGFKGSNLTNRGIVTHGTYSIVRHPAYVTKLTAWFLEGVLFASNLAYFAGWAGFAVIYFVRAWTEERHLSQDPDYVEYKQQVKYRFIPGVI